jgi:hypothetical protein
MRLKNPDQKFSADGEGASAGILDRILGTTERKRARPASSLDVKVPHGEQLTRPPKQSKQEKLSDKSARARSSAARNEFDFSDLDGMTEEQIMQALYDNPELAAAASAAAGKMHEFKKRKKVPPKTKSSSRRSRILSEHPDHIRAMMDEGVPIKQWIILIVLLGAGLYQLRKALIGSKITAAAAAKKLEKPVGGRKGSKKTKKGPGGGKPTKQSRSVATVRESASSPIERELVLEEQVPPAVAAVPKKTAPKKKKARKQKVSINKPPKQPAKDTMSHESPDSASTDGSSSTDAGAAQHDDALSADDIEVIGSEKIVIDTSTAESSPDDGWQTVGAPMAEIPQLAKSDDSPVAESVQFVDETPVQAMIPVQENKTAKKKNGGSKAKKTSAKKIAVVETPSEILDDDEALALKLQLEEDKLAMHEASNTSTPDVWEEVSTKKKGKRGC